jgi:hypothetical protein
LLSSNHEVEYISHGPSYYSKLSHEALNRIYFLFIPSFYFRIPSCPGQRNCYQISKLLEPHSRENEGNGKNSARPLIDLVG